MDLIQISVATSLDGYIDDASEERMIFSSPEDFADVQIYRAACDAILVGAGTLRKDNPSLLVREPALIEERTRNGLPSEPTKVVLTRSGNLDPCARFFATGGAPKIILCSVKSTLDLALLPDADVVALDSSDPLSIIAALELLGIRKLLVEGGSSVLTSFISAGVFHRIRLAIAPFFVGDERAPRFVGAGRFIHTKDQRLHIEQARVMGNVVVLDLVNERA
ncbi:MAG TPA: RibD family protein [Candidatus Baltobacteraceae bacterium]|jgi:5-amino-6-(5-phosphoribosylamino)uracil reductase|nr:RibD family protein [Candidatus Baltobacteraceae bacterium]